jgi:hypothetical protein
MKEQRVTELKLNIKKKKTILGVKNYLSCGYHLHLLHFVQVSSPPESMHPNWISHALSLS